MPKETKHAALICIGLSILAAIGIAAGIGMNNALITILCLVPAAGYEVYRTEGIVTRVASFCLLGILLAELFFVATGKGFDLAKLLGGAAKRIGGYTIPLGDIKIVGPTIMAILSVILFRRTYGIYTKWLAVILFITSLAIIYVINPAILQQFFEMVRGAKQL